MGFFNSKAFKQGLSFGVVSSAMTVLGLSVGMWTSGGNIEVLIASIMGLSISNALADAFSIYMANTATGEEGIAIRSALITGLVEFILPFLFVIPLLFMKLDEAIITNIIMGVVLVGGMGYYVSIINKKQLPEIIKRMVIYLGVLGIIVASTAGSGELTTILKPYIEKINKEYS